MPTFNVLLYCNALASKIVEDVEADTAEEACRIALEEDDGDDYDEGDLGESWVGSIVDDDGENVDVPAKYREAAGDAAGTALLAASRWMLALIDGGEAMPKPGDDVAEEMRAAIAAAEAAGITAEG